MYTLPKTLSLTPDMHYLMSTSFHYKVHAIIAINEQVDDSKDGIEIFYRII